MLSYKNYDFMQLKEHINNSNFDSAQQLLTQFKETDIAHQLLIDVTVFDGKVELVKKCCNTNLNNGPNQKSVSAALISASQLGKWDIVKYFCSMTTDNKPTQEAVSAVFQNNAFLLNLEIASFLCTMNGTNQPSPDVINKALQLATFTGKQTLVEMLCSMKTKNRPDQNSVAEALKTACTGKKWKLVKYLCSLKTDNKPTQEAVNDVLGNAATFGSWDIIAFLCAMTGDNKPDEDTITFALAMTEERIKNKWLEDIKLIQKEEQDFKEKEEQKFKEKEKQDFNEKEEQHFKQEEDKDSREEEPIQKGQKDIEQKEVLATRLKTIKERLSKINVALTGLEQKINSIDPMNSSKAFKNASRLLIDLKAAQQHYANDLNNPEVSIQNASLTFTKQCELLINAAKPVLEKDLGWGDYLSNLFKIIANVVIGVMSFGQINSFFKPVQSASIQAVEEFKQNMYK